MLASLALDGTASNTAWMDALAALRLQIAWGADEALGEAPIDRTPSIRALAEPVGRVPALAEAPRASLASQAADCAAAAPTIEALRLALASFGACPLAATATNLVFADGNPQAELVLVDDTPGSEEDLSGRPMAGPAGRLLDRMLASIGLDRSTVLIINLIPWRPPGGRTATEAEIAMCLPFLRRHLALLRPRLLVSLGALPSRALTGSDTNIRRLRGRWQRIELPGMAEGLPMLPIVHPMALLRTPSAKKDAWKDFLALQQALKGEAFQDVSAQY